MITVVWAGCYAILRMLHHGSVIMMCKSEWMPSSGNSLQDQYNTHTNFKMESMLTKCFVPNCVQYNWRSYWFIYLYRGSWDNVNCVCVHMLLLQNSNQRNLQHWQIVWVPNCHCSKVYRHTGLYNLSGTYVGKRKADITASYHLTRNYLGKLAINTSINIIFYRMTTD